MSAEHPCEVSPSDRYRGFADFIRLPLGENQELVYSPLTRAARVLAPFQVRLLLGCSTSATLPEHATRLAHALNQGPGQAEMIQVQLAALARAGFLVSEHSLTERCRRRSDSQTPPARISSVGVPTRNRTGSLEKCVHSYVDNCRRHGRAVDFVVVDDSDTPAVRAENRQMLQALRVRTGAEISYAGPEDKVAYAELLMRRADLPAEAVRFALLNDENCPNATGTSRNALLLHTTGDVLLQVDDDTVCNLAYAPGAKDGLVFTAQHDPTEFWFFPDGMPDPDEAEGPEDVLAIHEQLLAKDLGACFDFLPACVRPDLSQVSGGFFRRFEAADPCVLATATGVAGDSGMDSSVYLLSLDGESRARLMRSEDVYRDALIHHQFLRSVRQPTLGDGTYCMAFNLGLDNRKLLPPFMPVQRNQDGVFSALLRSCFTGGFFGVLPWAVLHRPPTRRRVSTDHLRVSVTRPTSGQVFQALVRGLTTGPNTCDAESTMQALGRALTELASMPSTGFEEFIRLHLWNQMSRQASHWDNQLRKFAGQPVFWAYEVKQLQAAMRDELPSPDYAVPSDLSATLGVEKARLLLQRLVLKLGLLLQAWPTIVEAARDLRANGVRLAHPI